MNKQEITDTEVDQAIEKSTEQDSNSNKDEVSEQETLAGRLVELVLKKHIYLFHDRLRKGYIKIEGEVSDEVYRLNSGEFSDYLSLIAWKEMRKPIANASKGIAIGILEAKAKFEGQEHKTHLRTAWHENALWYDLGDGRAVKVAGDGWEIVNKPPIFFKRFSHQRVQVEPVDGGKVSDILNYLNINTADKSQEILLLTYLSTVLIPYIPRPIMVLHGPKGSAKSTFFKVIKNIVDPSILEVLSYPRNSLELIQILSHHFLVCFDNLSDLDDWQSDDLCRACTGLAFSKRELFSDDNDIVYEFKTAIGLNGINLVATKPDLLDRALIFELDSLSREKTIAEETFWRKFESDKPKILGAVFTALSMAIKLRSAGQAVLQSVPRLADYAEWCNAVSLALGYNAEAFSMAYDKNIEKQNSEAIEASVVAQLVIEFMAGKSKWKGSAKTLWEEFNKMAETNGLKKDKLFPKSHKWVRRRINDVKSNLNSIGICVTYDDSFRPRLIILVRDRSKSSVETAIDDALFDNDKDQGGNDNSDDSDNNDGGDGNDGNSE